MNEKLSGKKLNKFSIMESLTILKIVFGSDRRTKQS